MKLTSSLRKPNSSGTMGKVTATNARRLNATGVTLFTKFIDVSSAIQVVLHIKHKTMSCYPSIFRGSTPRSTHMSWNTISGSGRRWKCPVGRLGTPCLRRWWRWKLPSKLFRYSKQLFLSRSNKCHLYMYGYCKNQKLLCILCCRARSVWCRRYN